MLSNATTTIDSVTGFQDYVDKAKECGMKALAISEHGNILEWWHKKCAIEKAGMKYIHAVEAYVTYSLKEKIRDNYHCLLIAKNYEGFLELNKLISNSFNKHDNHFYYSPRITYDELKNTSDNIIVSTGCLGGILNKADENLYLDFIDWLIQNKSRCFLEIQHHNVDEQIAYNKKLINLSKRFNIPLLATTDTHCLNNIHVKGREILQLAKNIKFEEESGWDLTFKTYDELCVAFEKQGISASVYKVALENTNKIADMVEPFDLDKNTKYPKIYDNPEQTFKNKINQGIREHREVLSQYPKQKVKDIVNEEFEVYKKVGAIDFMLLEVYLREWEKQNGIQCGFGRGSVSGSMIAYLLDVTQMNSLKFNLNFFRFLNPNRVSNADIDTDYSNKDREKIKSFLLKDHMNLDNIQCSEIITFNTIATKGAVKDVARALNIPLNIAQEISNQIVDNKIPDELRKKYEKLFEYVDIVNGVVVSVGSHPSGVLVTDKDIASNIGVCSLSTSNYPVSMLNMKELDDLMWVKLDLLGLDNVGVINETCKLIGIDRLNPDNVNLNDEDVWKSIRNDTTLIFQWESESSSNYLKKFMSDETIRKAKRYIPDFSYIKWFSFGNGLIRPACASYRDEVANGKIVKTGLKELDEFLAPTLGRVTMQEDIMQFLVKFCGYSQADSDNVRRAIAKKKGTEQLLPEIEQRFIEYTYNTFNTPKEKAEQIIKPFIQTILDASSYAFSWNHSDAYSCIGYISGYLRYYYPLEFLTSALNIFFDNEEKTQNITNYAHRIGIEIKSPKFAHSKSEYMCDKEQKVIYKGVNSIKNIQSVAADILYQISQKNPDDFLELLYMTEQIKVNGKKINKTSMEILIKLGFFDKFGDVNYLLEYYSIFQKYFGKTQVKKQDFGYSLSNNIIKKETEKTIFIYDSCMMIDEIMQQTDVKDCTLYQKSYYQLKSLGYTDIHIDNAGRDVYMVMGIEKNKYGTPFAQLYKPKNGKSQLIKLDKKWYSKYPIEGGEVLRCEFEHKNKSRKDEKGNWYKTDEKEWILKRYSILTKLEE
jgi:DNA polymerase-3 subunit alpha